MGVDLVDGLAQYLTPSLVTCDSCDSGDSGEDGGDNMMLEEPPGSTSKTFLPVLFLRRTFQEQFQTSTW